ncbi:hypothetical protein OG552_20575 [Streptomyces sp. NBC_01476]|uniref:hypothetical protein n=1 Tax=Streptomyces sp. NBC_01476 TaxID=2903881 RepID=UPI002E34699C|nr:hypothetical protein [Streptomyces sp. NBC_01476]
MDQPSFLTVFRGTARVIAAAGLAVDAYVHAKLASQYDAVTATWSQGDLFRAEAGLASLAALLVLVWRRAFVDAFALLVALAGLFAILLYRYVDVGTLGPLPNMYEPVWFADKTRTVVSQVVAAVATVFLLLTTWVSRIHARRALR